MSAITIDKIDKRLYSGGRIRIQRPQEAFMEQIEGALKVLGPSRTTLQALSVTTYSYIEIGDRIIKKITVFEGMNGPLQQALQSPGAVTLYVMNGYLCGVRLQTGKVYASEMVGRIYLYVVLASAAILGLITLPLLGMGLFFFYIGWRFWKLLQAKNEAGLIPDAAFI
jgi:hypothetical protein